ncbi:MAG: biotin/lipoyl-containing protein [Thermoleophilaceae bacterium]
MEADDTVTVGQVLCEIEAGDLPADADPDPADADPDPAGDGSPNGDASSDGDSGEGVGDGPAETVDVTLPEMGDSVAEGILLEWLVKVGDRVAKEDGLAEISTDKIDAELPPRWTAPWSSCWPSPTRPWPWGPCCCASRRAPARRRAPSPRPPTRPRPGPPPKLP